MIRGKFKGKFSREDVIKVMTEAVDLAKQKGMMTFYNLRADKVFSHRSKYPNRITLP